MAPEDKNNDAAREGTPRRESDDITTSDGAVRQLEKADLVTATQPPPDPAQEGQGEVIPLAKERGGAPEDAVTESAETNT